MPEAWELFEQYVHYVYQILLGLGNDNVVVAQNVVMKGRTGIQHQFDVFYEFKRAGLSHKVVVECRHKKKPIDKDQVMAFKSKVEDVQGLKVVIVALTGFQSGSKKFASDNGLVAIEYADLPSLDILLGEQIEAAALPDTDTLGEPFWSIWEVQSGRTTGTLWATKREGRCTLVLFFSKLQAEQFLKIRADPEQFSVRGMTQISLRFYMLTTYYFGHDVCLFDPFDLDADKQTGIVVDQPKILKCFYYRDPPVTDADFKRAEGLPAAPSTRVFVSTERPPPE